MNKTNSNQNTIDILGDISARLYSLAQVTEKKYQMSLSQIEEGKAIAYGLARDVVLQEMHRLSEAK